MHTLSPLKMLTQHKITLLKETGKVPSTVKEPLYKDARKCHLNHSFFLNVPSFTPDKIKEKHTWSFCITVQSVPSVGQMSNQSSPGNTSAVEASPGTRSQTQQSVHHTLCRSMKRKRDRLNAP